MTIAEAILKSLEDLTEGGTATEVYQNIIAKNYYTFAKGKTPLATVQALLGDFIRNGDNRVKRVKNSDNIYHYYLAKNEKKVTFLSCPLSNQKVVTMGKTYCERDLHPLLVTFLKNENIYAKTIFHEQSNNSEEHQKWVHPDIIGTKFIEFDNKVCQSFFQATNRTNTVEIYSYELKKEIKSDYDLKRCFFQAVSNSSWANYGFLVAFEINDSLIEELERLNHSFGIGVIKLKANPYESQVLYPAKRRGLDFKTIEKLCNINNDFKRFIEQIEKVITADTKFIEDVKRRLEELCDKCFKSDSEISSYCKEKNVPSTTI